MLYRSWGSSKDEVLSFTSSIDSDNFILEEVKLTMKAHIINLYLNGYISKITTKKLLIALKEFKELSKEYEDIHEALEDFLISRVGDEAGWIGLGRSRNDHVATALRIKLRNEIIEILSKINKLRDVLLKKAKEHTNTIFPSFTHLQQAQPTTFSHYLTYIEEELSTNWDLLFSELSKVNRSPLGAGAIVGTNVKLDRFKEAELLGFEGIVYNTISATSSRADLISAISQLVTLMVTLSRIAEDMVIYSSNKIVTLPETHVATSSLMPQKRNPVTMEILRAKAGEAIGFLVSLLSIYKGLPSGYNLDLQEMNKYYWITTDYIKSSLEILISLFDNIKINNVELDSSTLATDDAELLSLQHKAPYRYAYFEIAKRVKEGSYKPTLNIRDSIKMKAVIGSPNFDLITNLIKIREDKLHEDVKKLESYNMNINSKLGELRVLEDEIEQGS
ncbi:argininosuccinate lyase [Sulfolobus sp. B1]|uniref:argininosuccinate lyase n=1 Tax=Sulfolobaceae TaxID=118883 RepID=UPI000845CCE9|nr:MULTISPECIES: argininosuccinate lyase [unclassified Sulfolobus]TRM75563.1 argininosuccinate lyase [Sulfolobus sp. A20-N-F8]TRM89268.1 argininosuccinate lyase [Sulfolobus sp. C3]TRM94475.1 argininosuccinate lyase [Sulfolobus sp. A20-N-G8]TRM98180.1 argininosuccinate lyase [Sulfolobus sp. F1]TRN02550.1 argininosuccinate lyase [Sulfolobus sp. E1]